MTTFLFCSAVALAVTYLVHLLDRFAHFLCDKPYESSKRRLSRLKLFLIGATVFSLLYGTLVHSDKVRDDREAAAQEWRGSMLKAGCKRTGYVATRSSVYAVWTCPDGMVYREFGG